MDKFWDYLGPNGVGKSTIFNLITGSGQTCLWFNIKFDGTRCNKISNLFERTIKFKIGYVALSMVVFLADLTLLENLKCVG